jgi:sugar O-acyltransferase (sialic acid O-acetyltransferase NeuD family)
VKRLAILGAGDLGLQMANLAASTGRYLLAGFFDDTRNPGDVVAGARILGRLDDVRSGFASGAFDCLVVAVGYNHMALRRALHAEHAGSIPFATLVHPSAIVDPDCRIGEGAAIYPGCILDMGTEIGENVLLNVGCTIAHHSRIGSNSFVSPAVSIAGFVEVEPGCVLGIGTVVIDNIRITAGSRTGAGAVVTGHLDRRGLYLGIPARFAKDIPA